jgi:hypothetical protein
MNKRILDGAALWKSDKLARVQPEWMRAEYANWIPLALANGVFESDTRRIWATVYSYNRPDISFEDADEIKREFCRVGLLFLWPDEATGKVWGYFTGIEKQGRLPPRSRLNNKHEPIGPFPPADTLRSYVELTRSKALDVAVVSQWLANGCLGFGIGIGTGLGTGVGHTRKNPAAKPAPPSVLIPDPLEQETKEAGFSVFWEKWPVHQARQTAFRAWMKIPIGEYAAIMQGLEKWSVSDQWKRGVVPHAATWLNQKRWQDEDIPINRGSNGAANRNGGAVPAQPGKYVNQPVTRFEN